MSDKPNSNIDRWTVRTTAVVALANSAALFVSEYLWQIETDWPAFLTWLALSLCVVALAFAERQRRMISDGECRLREKKEELDAYERDAIARFDHMKSQHAILEEQLEEARRTVTSLKRIRNALPHIFEKNGDLRRHITGGAIHACLKGDHKDFVKAGVTRILTTLQKSFAILLDDKRYGNVFTAAHIGEGKRVESVYADGAPKTRKDMEREYVRSEYSIAGLVRQHPAPLVGDALEDRPQFVHGKHTHSDKGWDGHIHKSIQSYCCEPLLITHDGRTDEAVGVIQVDSTKIGAFPEGTRDFLKCTADAIAVILQVGLYAEHIEKQDDAIVQAIRRATL